MEETVTHTDQAATTSAIKAGQKVRKSANAVRKKPANSNQVPSKIGDGVRVDKSTPQYGYERRPRAKSHLKCLAELPYMVCNRQPSHAHFLKFAQRRSLG